MREASYYGGENGVVHCLLCPRNCHLRDGQLGLCSVRKAENGKLYSLNYEQVSSIAVDPIEKKPLYHFYPGSHILSIGTVGCNLSCGFCQNWQLSTGKADTYRVPSNDIVELATGRPGGVESIGIAFTYSEPIVWIEYVLEVARQAREKGLKNVLVTNGEIRAEPLDELLSVIDAMNIDVKAFTERFYAEICRGSLEYAKRAVEQAHDRCHVEVTTLLIPTLNDSDDEVRELVRWLASVDRRIPLHFSRYFPRHRMTLPPTPIETLRHAYDLAREELDYVYIGNVGDPDYSSTRCPSCGATLVTRGFDVAVYLMDGSCPKCGTAQAFVI